MENDIFNSLVRGISLMSIDQVKDLQRIANDRFFSLEAERMADLQKKATDALKNFLNAGGSVCSLNDECFEIDECPEFDDDDFYHIHLK